MSTHRHVKEALDRAVKAHRNAHRDHLAQAGLEQYTDDTVHPGPSFAGPEASEGGDDE